MRMESRLIKDILKYYYPAQTFHVQYKETTNYVDSADKIIVTICDKEVDIKHVIEILKKNTCQIKVYKKGEMATASEGTPCIKYTSYHSVYEADELRFIEVGYKKGISYNVPKM